jgi:hypothetical protein
MQRLQPPLASQRRRNLSPLDLARFIRRQMDAGDSHTAIALQLGMNLTTVLEVFADGLNLQLGRIEAHAVIGGDRHHVAEHWFASRPQAHPHAG